MIVREPIPPYRTTVVSICGMLALLALAWMAQGNALPPNVVGTLALGITGCAGVQGARSAAQHIAAARASRPTSATADS